ncbi:EEF1A lysine methyltransferase 4-like isoform X2 [Populus alba x Populus x berolinensis]|nr:EEF1A lysine methyltransferase 4-like isoform X2 [Populus alba x Populus x berolinensis]
MYRDVSSCNTYNYGDALYWDARYVQEAESFDWYQHYSSLRPFVRRYIPTSSRVLMVGCGNALMSEDMVEDGYENITNIDISSVAIDIMRRKYEHVHQLNYMEMDARDMSFFPDKSFDAVVDKGTLDSLMCGSDASISSVRMLGEVSRLLKPGGIYMLITYGDPKVRMPHLTRSIYRTMEVSCKAYASGSILSDVTNDISCVWSTKTESKSAQGSIAASYALRSPPN